MKDTHLVAIDPAYAKPLAIARERGSYTMVYSVALKEFLGDPQASNAEQRYAVIENQWAGKNIKKNIRLAQVAGIVECLLLQQGFTVVYAPSWGINRWHKGIENNLILVAKSEYPGHRVDNEDHAAALLLLSWLRRQLRIGDVDRWIEKGL